MRRSFSAAGGRTHASRMSAFRFAEHRPPLARGMTSVALSGTTLVSMTVLYETATRHPAGYREISPAQVAPFCGKVRLIDVREPSEYVGELGHAPAAELVPLATVEDAAASWDRDQEIVILCRSGARSGRAAATLASMGFRTVMNMTGGMLAWNEAGLPIER